MHTLSAAEPQGKGTGFCEILRIGGSELLIVSHAANDSPAKRTEQERKAPHEKMAGLKDSQAISSRAKRGLSDRKRTTIARSAEQARRQTPFTAKRENLLNPRNLVLDSGDSVGSNARGLGGAFRLRSSDP